MLSIRFMGPVTDSPQPEAPGLDLSWSGRLSLTARILAVNIFALLLLGGSLFYLDGYRSRLVSERLSQAQNETRLMAEVIRYVQPSQYPAVLRTLSIDSGARIRLLKSDGSTILDSDALGGPRISLPDPSQEPLQRRIALGMDRVIDWIVDANLPSEFVPGSIGIAANAAAPAISFAPDRTHMVAAIANLEGTGIRIATLRNARDIRRLVRSERSRLGQIIAFAFVLSILLSLFLARTIVRPLQQLADAAAKVRFGRAREVIVPRLPARRDEIGTLARALSDMTHALRERIDSTEAFAADVAHEMKNPLASMASAVQTLDGVKDAAIRKRLHDVIADDVRRLDRLITDISELSRIDSQLARARFELVDAGKMIADIVRLREERGRNRGIEIAFARPAKGSTKVRGDAARLERVVQSLLDNAVSFAPDGSIVRISATRDGAWIRLRVDDDGPGIPENAREIVFERFRSDRPEAHEFGRHSGLGLSIARAIVEAHGGTIAAVAPAGKAKGARLEVRLPVASG
jgi:two-component system, OmpR family, sensor histidine kinase ChvG